MVEVSFYIFLPIYAALLRRLGPGPRPRVALPARAADARRALRDQRRCGARTCTTARRRARRSRSSATTGSRPTSTCSRSAWGSPWCGRGPRRARSARRCSRRSAASTGCGGCSPRSSFHGGVVLDRVAAEVRARVGRQGVREGDPLQPHGVLPDPARGVRRAAHGRDAALPAAPADGVPRHDLVRHLPLAPGLHREGAPVGRLGRQAAAERAVPRST